jgi:hypothetical protein
LTPRLSMCCLLVYLALPSSARAYRTLADDPEFQSEHGPPVRQGSALEMDVHVGLPAPVPAYVEDRLVAAFAAWAGPECSSAAGVSGGLTSDPARPGDRRDTVMVVTSGWSALGLPSNAGATADVQLERRASGRWEIVEADIYVDWVGHPWQRESTDPGGGLDGAAVLRHEVGHCWGLAHPCETDLTLGPPCTPHDEESALFPEYRSTSVLSADDVQGICDLYPSTPCVPDCPAGAVCVAGECAATPDLCGSDAGVCGTACASDLDCGADVCAVAGPNAGRCVLRGGEGSACFDARGCASSLCLSGAAPRPYCTRACDGAANCGPGDSCTTVDDRQVCAPRAPAGCTVSAQGSHYGPGAVIAVVCVLFAYRFRRSRTR